jgi:hypothetical protein
VRFIIAPKNIYQSIAANGSSSEVGYGVFFFAGGEGEGKGEEGKE